MGSLEALPYLEAVPRGTVLVSVLVLRVNVLVLVSVLRPSDGLGLGLALTVLVLYFKTKTVQDTCWKVPATYQLTRNPAGKVLDNDQLWGLWPRWISSRLHPPTIPRSVATLLEVMVCAYYFCTGRTYILTKRHHYARRVLLEMLMLLKYNYFTLAFVKYSGKFCLFHS